MEEKKRIEESSAEKTLVLIKPDGIQRGLIGEIVGRYERSGLKLVAIKMFVPNDSLIEQFYTTSPGWKENVGNKAIAAYRSKGEKPPSEDPLVAGDRVLTFLKKYISSCPVIAMVWMGVNAVGIVRKITGGTEPLASDMGTIRGDLTIDSYRFADISERAVRNLVHASETPELAQKEIELWFNEKEINKYRLAQETILYDVNLDGFLE
jgi:nucleoside-diphosphate kinase